MNKYYFYKTKIKSKNALVCYYSGHDFDGQDLAVEVSSEFKSLLFVQNLILITPKFNSEKINKYLEDKNSVEGLKDKINTFQSLHIHCIYVDRNGEMTFKLTEDKHANKVKALNKKEAESVLSDGLYELCKRRALVQSSPDNYHYVKPSGRHTQKFIQLSNILESTAETSFIAIHLLKYAPKGINKIYVDTSAIYPLAYELSNLICSFRMSHPTVEIDAYGSYGGIDEYDFSSDEKTLIIISATTSNGLYEKMKMDGRLETASVVSVVSAVNGSDELKVVMKFNTFLRKYVDKMFEHFSSYREDECPMCINEHSIPLFLDKKRFIFNEPKLERYMPLAMDSDAQLRKLIHNYKNTQSFRCLFDAEKKQSQNPREYFVDIERLIESSAYLDKVKKMIHRDFPMGVDYVIYAGSCSKGLAQKIVEQIKLLGINLSIISSDEIIDNIKNFKKGVVVVTGFLQTGKTVLNVSRALRACKEIPITYIVGFATYSEKGSYEKLQMDLKYSDGSYGHHKYFSIEEMLLPIDVSRTHSWGKERELITHLINSFKESSLIHKALQKREHFLRAANSDKERGISSSLFLESPTQKKLILGPTFAFWSAEDNAEECSDHSLVYYTISSVLQKLRTTAKGSGKIPLGKGYITRVLDPLLFDRFNEGIIHAAILRAALPRELDFRCDDDSSRVLQSMLNYMMKNPDDKQSEALPEFLLAICTKNLQIKKDYLDSIKEHDIDKKKYPIVWCLAEEAKKRLFCTKNDLHINEFEQKVAF